VKHKKNNNEEIFLKPLSNLFYRGQISNADYKAALELWRCYQSGVVEVFGADNPIEILGKISLGFPRRASKKQIEDYNKYMRGIKAIKPYELVVHYVVCLEQPITERSMGGNKREKRITRLYKGLKLLAEEFGFKD